MAPGTPSWLNVDFTERILRLVEDDNTLQVIDVFSKAATNKGDNFTSDMMRVNVELTRKQGDKMVNEKKSLILKMEPTEGVRKEMLEKSPVFDTEITMLTDTLKKMNEIVGDESRFSARVYYVKMERPLCLIIEDLAPLGFRMADRQVGLDLHHCMTSIRGLARFHATSVALCEKEPKHKSLYTKGICNEDYPENIMLFFQSACKALAQEVENWPEFGKGMANKIGTLSSHLYEKTLKVLKRNDDEFNVINHGDCWVNNMLFRYDDNGKPVQHIFVDFQLAFYSSPAIDLLYFVSTSLSEDVYDNHLDLVFDEYLRTLSSTMREHGCKTPPPTMDELKRCMKERALYGVMASIIVLPILLVNKNEVKDLDEMMNKNGTIESPGVKSAAYRRIMSKRLPKYDEMGLLDS